MDNSEKQQRLAQATLQQVERMRRAGLFTFRRVRAQDTGTMDHVVQRPELIDIKTGKLVAEIDRLAPGQKWIEVPDSAFRDV